MSGPLSKSKMLMPTSACDGSVMGASICGQLYSARAASLALAAQPPGVVMVGPRQQQPCE